ncbi:hypothetical protein [Desulfothermobacter acidiphilus]|uniref:hypothetical protein n=1 Tax=Desulfothermobacter acidiphilus TaxID=1938353 RepID=UPI003F8AB7AA
MTIISKEERLFLPCPCGSQQPYIDCCGSKVVQIGALRASRLAQGLKRKLSHFAQHPAFTEAAVWAQHLYFSELAGSLLSLDEDFVGERCFEWFIFDFPVAGEHTVLELFSRLYREELTREEQELIRDWRRAPNSFYEIKAVGKDRILLQDLFKRGKKYIARGFAKGSELTKGTILYLRLLRVGGEYEFSTAALSLAAEAKPVIRSWIGQDYQAYKEARGQKRFAWSDYLRERSHRIMAWASFLSSGRDERRAEQEGAWGEKLDRLLVQLEEQLLQRLLLLRNQEEAKEHPEDSVWGRPEYAEVARVVAQDLQARGSGPQVDRALALWHRFCLLARPTIRKTAVWAAALVYAIHRLEGNRNVNQQRVADEYGVSVSSVSVKYRLLCRSLGLE